MVDETPVKKKAPAGWYDDPKLVNTRRYWDGEKWTENRIETSGATGVGAPPAPAAAVDPTTSSSKSTLVWVGIVIAVIVVWTVVASFGGDDGPDRGPGDRFGAEDVCKQAVKDRLKAPATAKFSSTKATLSGGSWTVTGAVDSENSFGALVRGNFTCQADHQVDENWTTRNVRLLE